MTVDDEPDLLAITKKMLEQDGYVVHGFKSPIKAVEHVKDDGCKDCSIVLSDVRMPGMSGFELVRKLKEARPEIRVILMTAFEMNNREAQIVLPSTKVDAFLSKPFTKSNLIEAIRKCSISS
jgi:CheY-like chemotaxis protein